MTGEVTADAEDEEVEATKVVGIVTLNVFISPKMESATPSSAQPTSTPIDPSFGKAKHFEFLAHVVNLYFPEDEHVPVCPPMHAICPVIQAEEALRVAN